MVFYNETSGVCSYRWLERGDLVGRLLELLGVLSGDPSVLLTGLRTLEDEGFLSSLLEDDFCFWMFLGVDPSPNPFTIGSSSDVTEVTFGVFDGRRELLEISVMVARDALKHSGRVLQQ